MSISPEATFARNCELYPKLKGLEPKTTEAYSPAIRRIGKRFDHRINGVLSTALHQNPVRVRFLAET
jgi:hypothetical protein